MLETLLLNLKFLLLFYYVYNLFGLMLSFLNVLMLFL